ncbi:MAG: selenide, water dikinase SelD, partial [Candidatus Thorarchaeota archaeon]|nr:selenide, water dikinase SelD [Candidatus Thorarchaeota archaeon]
MDAQCHELVGEDAVVHIVNEQVAVVENVDVFTPIHDDPRTQGEIVACNATNDVFAMGVTDIVSLQALLAYPKDLPENIPVGVLKGMNAFVNRLGISVSGGQTITNPVPVFGGIAMGVIHPKQVVYSRGAKPGDTVLLTKPLGIQPAMRSYRD